MTSFPPPTGPPATMFPRPDPWAEQARRREQYEARRRRRRRRWIVPLVVSTVVIVGAGIAMVVADSVAERTSEAPATGVGSDAPAPTVPPDQLVEVDLVWLIDRGDGTFDWGVSVRTPAIAPTRSGVVIDVRLVDVDGDVVETATGTVDGIGPDAAGAVAGRSTVVDGNPVRIEFDVAVGVPSDDRALSDLLTLHAVERTDESLSGRIGSDAPDPIEGITMVLLWLDDAGDVVAVLPQPVERVRPDVEVRFDIDLRDEKVPDRPPDDVVWST